MRLRTQTKPLIAKDYITDAGQLQLSLLVDNAVEALGNIRINGVGRQRGRSRGVIIRSFLAIAVQAGYTERQAHDLWRNQVLAIESLAINADE